MTWAKLDDKFPTHPKIIAAGGDAAWLHVCALCYCAEHLTDGVIPKGLVARLSDRKRPVALAERLVEVGMWIDAGDHYRLHDYLAYNPSREEVEADRKRRAAAGAKGAAKRWGSSPNGTSHSGSDATASSPPHCGPDAPDPTRPEVPSEPKKEPRSRKRPKTPIGLPFVLSDEQIDWVRRELPNLDYDAATAEWVEWCKANDARYSEWNSAWRGAMRRNNRWHKPEAARTHL